MKRFQHRLGLLPRLQAVYRGLPSGEVTVNGEPLNPRFDLHNHSPDGFSWGYNGSGPAQLALAIVSDFLGNDCAALDVYQDFKREIVANLVQDQIWALTGEQLASTETLKLLAVSKVMES